MLAIATVNDLLDVLRRKGMLLQEMDAGAVERLVEPLIPVHGLPLVKVPRREEMTSLLSAVDMAWGASLTACAATAGFFAGRLLD